MSPASGEVLQRGGGALGSLDGLDGEAPLLPQVVVEIAARDIVHHHVQLVGRLEGVVQLRPPKRVASACAAVGMACGSEQGSGKHKAKDGVLATKAVENTRQKTVS